MRILSSLGHLFSSEATQTGAASGAKLLASNWGQVAEEQFHHDEHILGILYLQGGPRRSRSHPECPRPHPKGALSYAAGGRSSLNQPAA